MTFSTLPEDWKEEKNYRDAERFLDEDEEQLWVNLVDFCDPEKEASIDKIFVELGLLRKKLKGENHA